MLKERGVRERRSALGRQSLGANQSFPSEFSNCLTRRPATVELLGTSVTLGIMVRPSLASSSCGLPSYGCILSDMPLSIQGIGTTY